MGCTEAKPDNAIFIKKVMKNIYEIIYTDGMIYNGGIKNGMRSGQGECTKKIPRPFSMNYPIRVDDEDSHEKISKNKT